MANCGRQIHGQAREASTTCLPAPKLLLTLACLLPMVGIALLTPPLADAAEKPELFLAPEPGVINIYVNGEGLVLRQAGLEKSRGRTLYEEEICCFGPHAENGGVTVDLLTLEIAQLDKEQSITTKHTLFADGQNLMQKVHFGNIKLIDFSQKQWTNPILSSPGMPKEATCKVISQSTEKMWGKYRLVVEVQCKAYLDGKTVYENA